MEDRAPSPRRTPRQRRSRAIVDAIVQAGRELLATEGPGGLTTNRIAERAGVSIGSLYRYFPNKEAVVAAVCEGETGRQVADLSASQRWPIEDLPLREALAAIVDFQLDRHRQLLALGREFYRAHHGAYALTPRMGAAVEQRLRAFLAARAPELHVRSLDHAAFLVARGLSAIVRKALDERPALLADPTFRTELIALAETYLTTER